MIGHGTLAWTWVGADRFAFLDFVSSYLSVGAAAELERRKRSYYLQLLITDGVVKELWRFSEPSYEYQLGLKQDLSANGTFELAVIQSMLNFINAPDFGVRAGVAFRFGGSS